MDLQGARVSFDTVIEGLGFKYAAFLSYIGLPLGLVQEFSDILRFFNSEVPIFSFIAIADITLQIVAICGLYAFKRYAFVALAIKLWSILIINLVSFVIFLVQSENLSAVTMKFIPIIFSCWTLFYFYTRRKYYKN